MRPFCLALVVLLSAVRAWAQDEAPPPSQNQITVEEASFDEKGKKFALAGKAALPDDTIVCGSVVFAGVPGQFVRGAVKDGAFALEFEAIGDKWILSGSYTLRAEVRQEDQPPEATVPNGLVATKEIQIGTPEKQAKEVDTVKKQLLQFTENCRQLFFRAEEKGSYLLLGIDRKKKANKDGKLSDSDKQEYMKKWTTFAGVSQYWITTYNQIRMGYDDYHNNVYLSYYPDVEQSFRAVLETLEKWFYSYWHDICTALDVEIPQEIVERGQFFDRASVEASLTNAVDQIYAALQVQALNWHPVTLWDSEEGTIVKNTYTSKTATFEVSRPDEQWDFKVLTTDPVLRLRIEPHDSIRASHGYAIVEVKDFPDSEGPKDLTDLVEMSAHDRYGSYKKIESKAISVPDPNFPGGSRPGLDLYFQYESQGIKFKVRSYELFCGTFKRTYACVCFAYQEDYEQFKSEFGKMCGSFKVLKQALPEDHDKK